MTAYSLYQSLVADNYITHWTPEHYLWADVMFIALREAHKNDRAALKWFFSDDTTCQSFLWVCRILNIEHLSNKLRDTVTPGTKEHKIFHQKGNRAYRAKFFSKRYAKISDAYKDVS